MLDRAGERPTWLEIDLSAIRHNFLLARRKVAAGVAVFPVIKADGYGLGALAVARVLSKAGADGFCVALLEEAEVLRRGGIKLPIILLSGLATGLEEAVVELQLQPFVFDRQRLAALSRAVSRRAGQGLGQREVEPMPLFLKVDTGMGRLGMAVNEVAEVLAEVKGLAALRMAGLVSHLACADQPAHLANQKQWHCLQTLLQSTGMEAGQTSLANSAALLALPETHFSWVRPGIMLYGASPFFPASSARQVGLQPVAGWYTRILQVRHVPAGTPVGYGQAFITQKPSRIALLPVGYADGYNRLLSSRARVLIKGQRLAVVGRISMDLTAIDITSLPQVESGQLVTLLGKDGAESIDVEEMASWRETLPYEVLCDLGQRLPRRYLGSV